MLPTQSWNGLMERAQHHEIRGYIMGNWPWRTCCSMAAVRAEGREEIRIRSPQPWESSPGTLWQEAQ